MSWMVAFSRPNPISRVPIGSSARLYTGRRGVVVDAPGDLRLPAGLGVVGIASDADARAHDRHHRGDALSHAMHVRAGGARRSDPRRWPVHATTGRVRHRRRLGRDALPVGPACRSVRPDRRRRSSPPPNRPDHPRSVGTTARQREGLFDSEHMQRRDVSAVRAVFERRPDVGFGAPAARNGRSGHRRNRRHCSVRAPSNYEDTAPIPCDVDESPIGSCGRAGQRSQTIQTTSPTTSVV
jgi:hypothetical protein